MGETAFGRAKQRFGRIIRHSVTWADAHVPWGLRSVLGLLLICGGVLGFLPILGFWMIPLGLAFIALDIPPSRRWLLRRFRVKR